MAKQKIEMKKAEIVETVVELKTPELVSGVPLDPMIVATMRPELYWEWRTTIEELDNAKLKKRITNLEKELLAKHIENQKLRLDLFKDQVAVTDKNFVIIEKSYHEMVKKIEEEIGMSLKDCAINELFEVKKL